MEWQRGVGGRGRPDNYKLRLFKQGLHSSSYSIHVSTSIVRVKSLQIIIFLSCVMLFVRQSESQQRLENSLEDIDWEEAEDDQQCEMVVKCKPVVKTTSSPSSSSKQTKTDVSPEISTYRVPLKPYGAPFNPMAEGGSVMWQKMGATPKNSARGGKKTKSATTTRGDKFERDLKRKKANSLLGRKKSHKLHKGKGGTGGEKG